MQLCIYLRVEMLYHFVTLFDFWGIARLFFSPWILSTKLNQLLSLSNEFLISVIYIFYSTFFLICFYNSLYWLIYCIWKHTIVTLSFNSLNMISFSFLNIVRIVDKKSLSTWPVSGPFYRHFLLAVFSFVAAISSCFSAHLIICGWNLDIVDNITTLVCSIPPLPLQSCMLPLLFSVVVFLITAFCSAASLDLICRFCILHSVLSEFSANFFFNSCFSDWYLRFTGVSTL